MAIGTCNKISNRLYFFISFLLALLAQVECAGQLVYAVNCGGEAHTDVHGIKYGRDPLFGRIGEASDYGKRYDIARVPPEDHILYQTERYHSNTFGYDIPITSDGEYVLVLKFSEVYFEAPGEKVFDVVLNGEHTVIPQLDIFAEVGKGVAHDEYIIFKVFNGRLEVEEEQSEIRGRRIRVEFVKGPRDNPKVNAMYIVKGQLSDVPKLPAFQPEPRPIEPIFEEEDQEISSKPRKPSGPIELDPYSEEPSLLWPIFLALGAAVPIVFGLCKL